MGLISTLDQIIIALQSVCSVSGRIKGSHTKHGQRLLFTVHRVNTGLSETTSQQQDVVVRHVLAQQHPLPTSLINSPAVTLSSCPSNRNTHTHTSTTGSPSANVTYKKSELSCLMLLCYQEIYTLTNCKNTTGIIIESTT